MITGSSFEEVFRAAGWFPGRHVDIEPRISADHPAASILAALTGLTIRNADRDEIVCFEPIAQNDDRAARWETALGCTLVGVGEIHNRHGELYVDSVGRLFGNSIIHPAFWFVGASFEASMHDLLAGARSRPMLLSNEVSVRMYGRDFTVRDPEVLTARTLNA